jgi:hypothetical protein
MARLCLEERRKKEGEKRVIEVSKIIHLET